MEEKKSGRGGFRPGAGRKPAPKVAIDVHPRVEKQNDAQGPQLEYVGQHEDPMSFLLALMNNDDADIKLRADAAKAMLPFKHVKLGEGGKKQQEADLAKKVASKFAASTPPALLRAVK